MEPLWLAYGAIAGLIAGVLWGRFHTDSGRRPRGILATIGAFVGFIAASYFFEQIKTVVPSQFWLTLFIAAWFVEPLGRRLRELR